MAPTIMAVEVELASATAGTAIVPEIAMHAASEPTRVNLLKMDTGFFSLNTLVHVVCSLTRVGPSVQGIEGLRHSEKYG